MDIKEILNTLEHPADYIISKLKEKSVDITPWKILEQEYDPKNHPVMDKSKYPDVVEEDGSLQPVTRVALNFQKLAAKRLTQLCYGIPVKRVYDIKEGETHLQKIADTIDRIFTDNRIDSVNIERGHFLNASCETMTLWYAIEEKNSYYGIPSALKLKCVSFSPMKGDELYPLFDEYGNLMALSVQYSRKEAGTTVTYFDTYAANRHIKWRNEKRWEIVEDKPIIIGKIPAIYMYRPTPAWEHTSGLVYEYEWTISRNGNYLRENSRPVFVVTGDEEIPFGNEPSVDKAYKSILRYPQGTTAQYVTWAQSVESLRFQTQELRRLYFEQLQIPDWSFENMKGIPMSGEAMKQMYIDAIQKAREESGRLLEFHDREMNVVKAWLKQIKPEWSDDIDALRVSHVITPCTVDESSDATAEQSGEQTPGAPSGAPKGPQGLTEGNS